MTEPLESDEQKALILWLKQRKIMYFAPMNENSFSFLNRDIVVKIQAKNKAMGSIKGTPDLVIFLPNKIMFLELKRRKSGVLSKEQKDFLSRVNEYPYAIGGVAHGWIEASAMIEYYMELK